MSLQSRPFIRWEHRSYSDAAIGAIALTVSICSGSTFNAFSKQLSEEIAPLSLIFISEVLTMIFALIAYGLFPTIDRLKRLNAFQWRIILAVGFFTGIAGPFLWFSGISYTTAINAGFYSRIDLIFMILLAHFALKETLTRMHWTSMLTIFAGMITISLHGFTNGIDFRSGDTLIMLSVLFYSLGHILYRKYLHDVEAYLPLFMRSVSAVVLFLLISPFMNMSFIDQVTSMPAAFIAPLLGFAFISRFLNSVTFYQAVNRLSMTVVSLVSSLSLVGSTLFASLYLGESLYWYHFAGALLIVGGSVIADVHHKRPIEHTEHQLAQKMHS